jgi:hypothetical protein
LYDEYGSFPEVQRPGRGVNHLTSSSAEVKGRVELNIYSPSGPSWQVIESLLPSTTTKNDETMIIMVMINDRERSYYKD